jgi:hypothetical protein
LDEARDRPRSHPATARLRYDVHLFKFALLSKPLVQRLDGVSEICRGVLCAVISQKMQLIDHVKGWRIKFEALIDTRRPTHQNAAHVTLSPRQIVSLERGVRPNIFAKLQAGGCAQTTILAV